MAYYDELLERQVQAAVMKQVFQKYAYIRAGDISGESVILVSQREVPWFVDLKLTKLRGLSPHANYTDRAAAAGRRS